MRISDILKRKGTEVVTIRANQRIAVAIEKLNRRRIGALVILDDGGEVLGILSEHDIIDLLAERGDAALALKVSDLSTRPLYVCAPGDGVKDAMVWMTQHRVRHLPVIENGELRGLVSIGDLVKSRLDEVQTEANILRDIAIARH